MVTLCTLAHVVRKQGSLGYIWLIPSFEATSSPTLDSAASLHFTTTIEAAEIDFFKAQSGIQRIELDMEWVVY